MHVNGTGWAQRTWFRLITVLSIRRSRVGRHRSAEPSRQLPDHEQEPTPMRIAVRGTTVAVAAGLMVIVPFSALDDPRPSPLGWHMYAGSVAPPSIQVTRASGITESRSLHAIAAHLRSEPDYTERAAEFICTRDMGIKSVRFTRDFPALDREFSCKDF